MQSLSSSLPSTAPCFWGTQLCFPWICTQLRSKPRVLLFLITVCLNKGPSLSFYLSVQRVPHHCVDANLGLWVLDSVCMSKTKILIRTWTQRQHVWPEREWVEGQKEKEGRGGRNGWMFSGAWDGMLALVFWGAPSAGHVSAWDKDRLLFMCLGVWFHSHIYTHIHTEHLVTSRKHVVCWIHKRNKIDPNSNMSEI